MSGAGFVYRWLVSASPLALAVDFGGTKVEAALVDADGVLLGGSRHRRPTGRTATVADLESSVGGVVRDALAGLPEGATIVGVGIGCAGPIDRKHGLVSPLNVPDWRDYPLRDFIGSVVTSLGLDVPVTLEMDGVAITMAEHWVGAAQGVDNVMGMVISTGIGGGLIVDGRVITGPTGNAGHIGHVEVGATFAGEALRGEDTFGAPTPWRPSPPARTPSPGLAARASPARPARSSPPPTPPATRSPSRRSPAPAAPSATRSPRRQRCSTWNWSPSAEASRIPRPTCSRTCAR